MSNFAISSNFYKGLTKNKNKANLQNNGPSLLNIHFCWLGVLYFFLQWNSALQGFVCACVCVLLAIFWQLVVSLFAVGIPDNILTI